MQIKEKNKTIKKQNDKIRKWGKMIHGIIIIMVIIFMTLIYSFLSCQNVKIKEETLEFSNLPSVFDGTTIVFISDVHADNKRDWDFISKQVDRINQYDPDLVILGGDFAESNSALRKTFSILKNISNNLGIFAVRGNHDVKAAGKQFEAIAKESSITPIVNQSFIIGKDGEHIVLAGIDDFRIGNSDPSKALSKVKPEDFCILLAHEPQSIHQTKEENLLNKADFALTGHTHGGQITLFGLYSPLAKRPFPGFTSQWVEVGAISTLYSNGIGQRWDLRFFASPQIHIINLKRG